MKKLLLFMLILSVLIILPACDTGPSPEEEEEPPAPNPTPTLSSISPTSKVAHMPAYTLTATGTDFITTSKIVFDGTEKTTSFVSATSLTCQIDPDDITTALSMTQDKSGFPEILDKNVSVLVRTPTPGGGDSSSVDFTIHDNFTFFVPKNVSNNSGDSYDPAIAVDSSGNINVVWEDDAAGNDEVYFSRSQDGGSTWSAVINLSSTSDDSDDSCIAIDSSGNISVAWEEGGFPDEIFFRCSQDNGASWSAAVNISNTSGDSGDPAIAVDSSGNINVVWEDDDPGNDDTYFARSEDNGSTWSQVKNVSNSGDNSRDPDIAVDNSGNINVVWRQSTPADNEVYYSRSTDNGATWVQGKNVSNNAADSWDPAIAVDSSGNINVVWDELTPGNWDIYLSRSSNNGAGWSAAVNISNNSGDSEYPAIAVDSAGNLNVVWHDDTSGHEDIYFSRSIDDGSTWTAFLNISNTAGDSYNPSIGVDSTGNINIVWEDDTPGNWEILFAGSTR